jgi:neutral ceramidase
MLAGWGKTDITPKTKNIVMMGYATPKNIFKTSATPLYCRAIVVEEMTKRYLLIYLDINFISKNLHTEICFQLGQKYSIKESEIHLTASHTHSAPGGYGSRLYYEIPTPGFQEEVFQTYVQGAKKATDIAFSTLSKDLMYKLQRFWSHSFVSSWECYCLS